MDTEGGEDIVNVHSSNSNTSLIVNSGDDADQINIRRTGALTTTTLDTGSGDDTVQVTALQLDSIVSFSGGDGAEDTLVFDAGYNATTGLPNETETIGNAGDPRVVRILGANGGTQQANAAADVENIVIVGPVAPVAIVTSVINEGESIVLDASLTQPSTGLSYVWNVNGSEFFASQRLDNEMETLTWEQLRSLGVDDGDASGTEYKVLLTVTTADGFESEAEVKFVVNNLAPSIAIASAATTVLAGETFTLDFSATDPGDDTIQEWIVDWGDGQTQNLRQQRWFRPAPVPSTGRLSRQCPREGRGW